MSVDSSDQDDRMQYVKKDLFQPINNPYNNHANFENRSWYRRQSSDVGSAATDEDDDDDDDDSSNRFFVSEASTSGASEADTSENLMQLGVLGGSARDNLDCLLFLDGSVDDEEDILLHDDVNFVDETLTRLPPRDPLTPPPPPPQSPPQTTCTTNNSRSRDDAGLGTTVDSTVVAATSLDNNNITRATRPQPPSTSHSPDNISLSSYDTSSPNHWTRKVHVDFSPVQSKNKNKKSNIASSTGHHSRRHASIGEMNTMGGDNEKNINTNGRDSITKNNFTHATPKRLVIANKPIAANSPSNSTSEASEGEVQLLEEFLQDLRINSEGQVKESSVPGSNTSFESSILLHGSTDVEDVLRRSVVAKTIPRQSHPPPPPPPPRHVTTATPSRNSFTRPLLMEHSDSFATKGADSIIMTFSDDTGDQQILVGDRIEASNLLSEDAQSNNSEMIHKRPNNNELSSPATTVQQVQGVLPPAPLLPPLPPLHSTTTTGGGKQQRENQRRRSDGDTQSTEQNKSTVSAPRGRGNGDPRLGNYVTNSDTSNSNISNNTERSNNRNNLKSTIDHSGDEWSEQKVQEREIRMFSQFAVGTGDGNDTPRRRRTRQRNNRRMRRHAQPDNGDDSSSCASSDQSYTNFSQSPTSSMPQSISDVSYESTQRLSPPPTISELAESSSNMQSDNGISLKKSNSFSLIQPIQSNGNRSLKKSNSLNLIQPEFSTKSGSYDGAQHGYLSHQLPPPQLDPNWAMYQPPLTGYIPGHHQQHVHNEAMAMAGGMNRGTSFDQRIHFEHRPQQHPHIHHYSATMPHFERPFDGNYNHPQQFFPSTPHSETTRIPDNFAHGDNNHSRSYTPSHPVGSAECQLSPQELPQQQEKDAFINEDSHSVSDYSSDDSIENQRNIHFLHEEKNPDTKVIRHNNRKTSLFLPSGAKTTQRFDRLQFLPQISSAAGNKYPTYVCPICKTRQREFFTVSSAPKQFEGAGSYIALFFAVYVITSLYVFGLQEGWGKLDCIYFAVITLTTAGLGDLVPTTDGAKIICSIFIYFGVACIGLLLGSYIAGMLDERSYKEAIANQIKGCPNCARIQNIKDAAQRRMSGFAPTNSKVSMAHVAEMHAASLRGITTTKRASKKIRRSNEMPSFSVSERASTSRSIDKNDVVSNISNPPLSFDSPFIVQKKMAESPTVQKQLLGSPMTSQILNRQSHTRHISMDLRIGSIGSTTKNAFASPLTDLNSERFRNNAVDIPATVNEGKQFSNGTTPASTNRDGNDIVDSSSSSSSSSLSPSPLLPPPPLLEVPLRATGKGNDDLTVESSGSSNDSFSSDDDEIEGRNNSTVNAKYVVLTLKEAFINSLVIIAFGCLGFYLIEGFSLIDSWYFTTVLLTSTGYGDIAPKSDGGKLFATVYLLVAGTILLNNMSMISMIPLELRKRRTEQAVLDQFGDSLDDDALHELATGPLIQRINLDGKDSRGLDECTREMFALAMLIRLGKVTEDDIKQTFAAFRKLDVNNDGVLNSKSIIGGLIQKRRSSVHQNRHSEQRRQQQATPSQGFAGSWFYPPPPPQYYEGSVPFAPNSQVNPADLSYNTPLLSMTERSFPVYGNRPLSAPGLYE